MMASLSRLALIVLMISAVSCLQRNGEHSRSSDQNLRYVGNSVQECATIRFVCEEGEEFFSNDAGCGCKLNGAAPAAEPAADEVMPAANEVSKRYIGHSLDDCARMRIVCEPGEAFFSDDKGCGCEGPGAAAVGEVPPIGGNDEAAEEGPTMCAPESREADVCMSLFEPVCGLFDPGKIQCIKAPCGQTFSNSCEACKDPNVMGYTSGECQ